MLHLLSSSWLFLGMFGSFVLQTNQDSRSLERQSSSNQQVRPAFTKPGKLRQKIKNSEKPNIVFIITDDQDVELGSLNFMPKTMRYMRDEGATFPNAFVTTPMCCPSRSSMLTGMYVHNHNTYTNNDNCSSPQWRQTHETRNFGTYLTTAGYRTGYFGKYLNEYSGTYIPPGWTEWMGLIRNTRFYNYSVNHNMTKIKHEDDYSKDYLTDLVANKSVEFFRDSKLSFPNRPVAMVLSMPAPHGPEDAAPQYQNKFFDVRTHRTPSWNFAPNPDKQWLLQYTRKMSPLQIAFGDLLQAKRLQTLQSVDDAVEKVWQMLDDLGELDNTYVIYTSDHGYHLGQYGLVKGKAMPYESDIKVPFFIRGPKIPNNIRIPNIVLNLDLAPTMLDIAGVEIPDHMDGNSILKLFDGSDEDIKRDSGKKRRAWRDTFLVERGKLTQRKLKVQEKLEAHYNRFVITKEQRLEDECRKSEYQPPCKTNQEWECRRNDGKLRIYKCRHNDVASVEKKRNERCKCQTKDETKSFMKIEKKRQLFFLQKNVNQPTMIKKPRFLNEQTRRGRRHVRHGRDEDVDSLSDSLSYKWSPVQYGDLTVPCRVTINDTVTCEQYVYTNVDQWESQKNKIDDIIKNYKGRISQLKNIRKHLFDSRPTVRTSDELDDRKRETTSNITKLFTEVDLHVEEEDEDGIEEESSEDDDECICPDSNDDDVESLNDDINEKIDVNKQKNRKLENLARRIEKQEERGQERKQRLEKNRSKMDPSSKKKHKRNKSVLTVERKCNSPDGSNCFSDEISQKSTLSTDPSRNVSWDGVDISLYSSRHDPNCHMEGLECSRMDNDHWKVAPYWTKGPFCFCPNSNNNTYWCLRTVNDSHNFLYCEFITGFISFYDMTKDPYQLRNAVHDLSYELLHKLHNTLEKMKACKGAKKCNLRSKPMEDERHDWKHNRQSNKHDKLNHQVANHNPSRSTRVHSK